MANPELNNLKKISQVKGADTFVGKVKDANIEGRNGEEYSVRKE